MKKHILIALFALIPIFFGLSACVNKAEKAAVPETPVSLQAETTMPKDSTTLDKTQAAEVGKTEKREKDDDDDDDKKK